MKKISILCLTLFSFLFSQSQIKYLKGNLQGSQETPTNAETGSGVVIAKYDMSTKTLKLYGDYAGLSDTITGSHLHIGQPGVAGPIIKDLVNSRDTTGTLLLSDTLTQMQEDSLLAGNIYANVHTTTHPAGELRAQLTVTIGQTTILSGRMQGAQETPPDTSKAMGSVYALVDMGTDSVFVTGYYKGLTAASTFAHVHLQNPGTPGAVLFAVYHSSATAGAVHAMTKVTTADATTIAGGGGYVNVHTATFPNGEIRGQLINNTTVRYFAGEMKGSNEVPPNLSAATGTVIASYNSDTKILQLAGDYQHLSDTVVASHIHLGAPGVAGPVVITLTNTRDSTGTISVTTTLADSLVADLFAGNLYANVHSALSPGGEIRTQLIATASGETQVFATNLMGTQEVPSNSSMATGNALIILDKTTGLTYVTGAFSGINSLVNGAHIHRGRVGVAGPIILPLRFAQHSAVPHSGTVSGSGILSPSLVDSMINGFTYINIHSTFFPNGAIRGQLGDLVLPLKLTYFNAYKQRNEIELIWETSEEVNVSRYEIEQLNLTNKAWITKGTVYPQGNSGGKYSYLDMPNLYGSHYAMYRLKMIDKDGRITYSSMVKVNYEKLKAELFIQTNPVSNGELHYTITGLSTGKKAEVSIIDYNGRLLFRNTISSLTNNTLKIAHLSAGMYKLIVRIDDTLMQQSFIK